MGLLDNTYLGSIFDEWKDRNNIEDVFKNADKSRATGTVNTDMPMPNRNTRVGPMTKQKAMMSPSNTQKLATPPVNVMPTDPIVTGGKGTQVAQKPGFAQDLANFLNIDYDKAVNTWKDKGGFEGLMSNPAFTLGLAFMAAGAEGKSIGQESLNSVLKAGAISQQYKKIIADRKQAPIQATAADVAEVKELLAQFRIKEPNVFERGLGFLRGRNEQANFDRAAEAIAIEFQKEVAAAQKANKSGKPLVIDSAFKEKIIKKIINSGVIKRKKGMFGPFTAGTVSKEPEFRMHGGPVEAGKPYVVGEEGPEVVIPKSDGNVLTTDDSQIFAMLLAANPQLQKVSKQRAEKILRARFPEYFEG